MWFHITWGVDISSIIHDLYHFFLQLNPSPSALCHLLTLAFELRMCFVCAKTMPNDSRKRTIWPFGVMCCLNSVIFLPLGDEVLASFSGLWVILPAACRTPSSPLSISPCLPHGGNYATLCRGFQEGGMTRRLCGRECVTVRVWWRWGRIAVYVRGEWRQTGGEILYGLFSLPSSSIHHFHLLSHILHSFIPLLPRSLTRTGKPKLPAFDWLSQQS